MITNSGMIIFSEYRKLEKKHDADDLIGIIQRITDTLDQEGLVGPEVSNKIVRERAKEIYEEIKNDYSTGFNGRTR